MKYLACAIPSITAPVIACIVVSLAITNIHTEKIFPLESTKETIQVVTTSVKPAPNLAKERRYTYTLVLSLVLPWF